MSSSHIIYIPAILLVGVILGFVLGGRAARDQARLAAAQDEQRKAAREARAARREAKKQAADEEQADKAS